jgi:hypothetical protein
MIRLINVLLDKMGRGKFTSTSWLFTW